MAADSSGVEWASIVKPILAASYGSFNKNDVLELVKAIVKSESDLLNHEEQYETFYSSFAALAADYISSSISSVCRSQLGVVCAATHVLLRYLVARLRKHDESDAVANTTALTAKQLLLPIRALCTGRCTLGRADQIALTATMKNAKLPPHIKTTVPGEKEGPPQKETKSKSRSDLSALIAEQLMTPLHDFAIAQKATAEPAEAKPSEAAVTESNQDTELIFTQKNVASLQSLNAGDILVDMCLCMPTLMRYHAKYALAVNKKGFSLPATHSDAVLVRAGLQTLVNDINMAWSALSLPVLEPLTGEKTEKLSDVTMACLYAAVSVATANSILGISSNISPKTALSANNTASAAAKPGEDEGNLDALAVSVVEKSLEIFNLISNVFKTSTRAGGHILQNHLMLGAWLLVTGLQSQLSASSLLPSDKGGQDKGKSPSKTRDPSSRINLMKVQQGFGVLSVALAGRALAMTSALLDDLQVEGGGAEVGGTELTPAQLHVLTTATALQRAARILSAAPLNQFLFYLATISYRKACTLKRIQKHPPEGDTFSTSDSTTYYDDDIISCSEESSPDEDEDSEPLLGLWFEETVSVPEAGATSRPGAEAPETVAKAGTAPDTASSVVPEKGEPNGYISLATQIFQFMNKYLVSSESAFLQRYVEAGLAEQQMVILAAIIRDLDRETARTDTGTISVYFGAQLGVLYAQFSQALTRYTHNLVARGLLAEPLQVSLLGHLGVSPTPTSVDNNAWPLQVYPRTLAVLAQILLSKPQAEKESSIINIWNRLIHTLVENVCNFPTNYDVENEDLNVEHAQLLLFLFHALNLMQKKTVLLACASGIVRVGEGSVRGLMRESQLLCLSRLLLLFEYMMKHLYDAPPTLLQQVQWNLFNSTSMVGDTVQGRAPARVFCPWKEIEDNYRKLGPQDEFSMKPRFYSIISTELNNQEQPKLDGLACNFILGSAEKVKYPLLLDVLIEILNVTDQTIPSIKSTDKISFTALCATQYCFTICWRLVLQLPPSTPYLDKLALGQGMPATPLLLHSLVWGPRAAHKFFNSWMKDALVKQGMYTQYAENLLKSVADAVNSARYDITLAKNTIVALMPHIQTEGWLVPKRDLPNMMELCLMDTVVAKVQVLTDETPANNSPEYNLLDLNKAFDSSDPNVPHYDLAQDLLPHILRLTEVILACSRTSLMYQINESSEASGGYSLGDFIAFRCVLAVSSTRSIKTQSLSAALIGLLPSSVRTTLDKWNSNAVTDFPSNTYANDIIPGESYVLAVVNAHTSSLSSQQAFTINPSLKHLLHSLVTFISDHIMKCDETNVVRQQAVSVLAPLTLDACTEYLHDVALRTLERTLGDAETDAHQACVYGLVLNNIYTLVINYTDATSCSEAVNEKLLQECLGWMEGLLERPAGRQALDQFFDSPKHDLMQILMSIASPRTCKSSQYSAKVLQFFNKLFNAAEKNPGDAALERLRASVLHLASVEANQLRNWLRHVILGTSAAAAATSATVANAEPSTGSATPTPPASTATPTPPPAPAPPSPRLMAENQLLLQYLTLYIISENSENAAKEDVAVTLLEALVPIGSQLLQEAEGVGFKELMVVMATLADAGSGRGHLQLFTATVHWLDMCKQYLCGATVLRGLEQSSAHAAGMVEACCHVVNYVSDVVTAMSGGGSGGRPSSPWAWDGEHLPPDLDGDWADELGHEDDDDSAADDSDEDSLCNKLCTFTVTQKEFMNQHWYHCHTCKMVDGVGVCTVCARVCHRDHDVTYAKYGNFFCDCGAKENGSCQALVKRSPQSHAENQAGQSSTGGQVPGNTATELTSLLRRRPSSPALPDPRSLPRDRHRISTLCKQLDVFSEALSSLLWREGSVIAPLLELLQSLMPAVEAACERQSPVGCYHRAQAALDKLHTVEKTFEITDSLMMPTLGSQEGAFENVRMNFTGDQGQTIRQLLSAHMIRRVAMCCLASPHGKRQHLVSHEKGKITVLQLSALLKQADSSKRKLTLTRLASAPVPFTVLSLTGNPCNEDFLAVCGLKDCHVLTFHPCGSVSEHLVLHPQLETGNFIIRAIWLPGSQTSLALVTADFVKIYDLADDVLSPQYYFLVPTGKIRDVTFICPQDDKPTMMLMSSTGYIYSQDMDYDSSAKHGPFYVTNTMDVSHPDIKDVNGQVCGGGVSVYYSHTLEMLFFSYAQGKSFMAAVPTKESLSPVFQIQATRPATANNATKANNATASQQPQPLCQWSEVPNHPGLVCSVMQTSNNPVILMVRPDSVSVQEIKVVPAKAKIMDTVAIRHPSSGADHRTTLILLCEDGSLRIYMAAMDHTGYWLSPSIQAVSTMTSLKSSKKKKLPKGNKTTGALVTFPVDFFEHSQVLNDVEFGGNDLLQIYNPQQIKNRLNTTGMYVVSTKSTGFNIEVANNDATHVMTGIRVLLGNQDAQRVPGYIEVFGRNVQTAVARNRWFDLPLTREESLQADKKMTITFGPSQDPDAVTMVDSVKVYGKSKDSFGWPEETEEVPSNTVVPTPTAGASTESADSTANCPTPITALDKVLCGVLEVLDNAIQLMSSDQSAKGQVPVQSLTSLVSHLLILPTASCVQRQVKLVLAALHPSRQSYHNYKDHTVLSHVSKSLVQLRQVEDARSLDAESFYRLVLMTRAIAVARPHNLTKAQAYQDTGAGSDSQTKGPENSKELLYQMTDILWKLHAVRPRNLALASVCVPGLTHVEAAVHCVVEIVHATTVVDGSEASVTQAVRLYLSLLLCADTTVSFSAKQAFIRVLRPRLKRRRVFIPSPPRCSTPGAVESEKAGPVSQPSQESSEADQAHFEVDAVEPMVLLAPDAAGAGAGVAINMEALLGAGGFPPLLDIPPDADDETMVELAIALSLQDHEGAAANLHGLANLHNLAGPALQVLATQSLGQVASPAVGSQEAGHYSDTTASAGASDDEGSTAATDGSTLRTSPAEQGGSESGGSGVDSITGEHNYSMSGRSSAYGDVVQENLVGARSETSSLGAPAGFQNQEPDGAEAEAEVEAEVDTEGGTRLHDLRLGILEKLIQHVPRLSEVGGVRAIPFMQVVLMLTSDLDGNEERDRACLENLLTAVIGELGMRQQDSTTEVCKRTEQREVHLVIMRLISVLMSRSKTSGKGASDNGSFISQVTATMLQQAGVIDYCLQLLKQFLNYWKASGGDESGGALGSSLLKSHPAASPPDMSPFFLKQYVKGHCHDVFKDYPQLLTEMALRLPYQVQKHSCTSITFEQSWFYFLCEYMMTQQAPFIRRHVRKLLLFICGTKEKYRQLRDLHSLGSHIKAVQQCCDNGGLSVSSGPIALGLSLSYDALVELIEHLKACVEVASSRTVNWQLYCLRHETILSFLLQVSCQLDEVVAQTILQLLQCAICPPTTTTSQNEKSSKNSGSKSDKEAERERDRETEESAHCSALVKQLNKCVERDLLTRFVRTFLLDTNATNVRWQAHALVVAIYKNSDKAEQDTVLDLMWSLWPNLPAYGRKAVQFVDLLGYFSIKCNTPGKMNDYIERAVGVLRAQNQLLARHPNAGLYAALAQYVELDGYFLESEPCLVCNNPEVPFATIKLSSVKIDSKFTTTTQIVKLVGSHTISKITLRIGDLKRTKMVRTINIYYNNRTVQAVVELKNKPAMWHKAKKVSVASGQTEVKMEFPLPIVACNLMIEYADFYENLQASSESLQCPRCSSSVPANPGVCANCGENVFQCHKCRAINYDEKDPFLCHACGFCKYAKFDYTLVGRPCCAVDPIENDEDRKKAITTINGHLEKADRVYKQLVGNKPTLENLLVKISEHRMERGAEEAGNPVTAAVTAPANSAAVAVTPNQVNRAIQMLAQRYCGDCRNSFDELSRIIQRVHACRRELVAYDRAQLEQSRGARGVGGAGTSVSRQEPVGGATAAAGRCFGCASAATEHCLTLLRALAVTPSSRKGLCAHGLVQELVEFNLRKGTVQVQEEVRQLLCMVTRDNAPATEALCHLISERITATMRGHAAGADLAHSVRPEIALLAALIRKEDSCWELKLRSVMQLFLMASKDNKSPVVMESVLLPCLKILQSLIKPDQPGSKKYKDKTLDVLATVRPTHGVHIDRNKWLEGDPGHTFDAWRKKMYSKEAEIPAVKPVTKEEVRRHYLMEKYGRRWREHTINPSQPLRLTDSAWLKSVLFNSSSRLARQVACNMLESICQVPVRKKEMLDLLTAFLSELGSAGENAAEFLSLYQSLVQQSPWKHYLAVKGVLMYLADLLTREIDELHRLEETTLTSDLAQGYALKMLTELMASFLDQDSIRQLYKGRLVGAVLNGYLSLRRLVVQRTRLVDDTQEKLLELLEEMTTGTEAETKAFMAICIETVEKCSADDVRTPVFVFERLCSIIYPEENDVGEFYLTLEKDPQQEDFLQGRMLGNPYSSNEPGLGPLMRDVKNKICQDCELVALLEDDNGMELLVNNKIISLDLPVREVYKKIWVAEGGEGDVMRVVYRMRGLLGDATEEFVETVTAKSEQEVDNEEVYKMANVMADCGGLQVMLKRLAAIGDTGRSRSLLQVLLKLLSLCIKVRHNVDVLTRPELATVASLLNILQLCLTDPAQSTVTQQILDVMENVLSKASSMSAEEFSRFSTTLGGPEHIRTILEMTETCASVRSNPSLVHHLTTVLAALTYGSRDKMAVLIDHFRPSPLDFNTFDLEHTPDSEAKLELFCNLTAGIDHTPLGNTLKDYIVSLGIVEKALEYISMHAPSVKPTLMRSDSDEWKEYISKPALKYVLRLLTGLATQHDATQLAVSAECIPIIHRLEGVSSDEHVGSLAENLLEALRSNEAVAARIQEVRTQTRAEKKRLAMAMREKQLGALGMRTNDKGQVTAESNIMQQMEELGEETGLVCVICREGYKFQPSKVLGIYTYTKRCNVEESEAKARKTVGYSTVTHFNVVHVDCHMNAVRLARARDEWESAALQNANTRCNGLLPLWGPQVPESAFASCLARHNTYLQECTGHRDIGYASTVHDQKLLLLRFAQEKSFHEDAGGGGPQSNMHLIPYLLHMTLYVINTTRCGVREEKNLSAYLDCVSTDRWLDSCYEAEGPLYWATLSLCLHSPGRWRATRLSHLRRLITLAHARHVSPNAPQKITDPTPADYAVYKPVLVFFGLIDIIYRQYFKTVTVSVEEHWPTLLADYVRHNDEALIKCSERLMAAYSDELLPSASFEEFCDVIGLLGEITDPSTYIKDLLAGLVS